MSHSVERFHFVINVTTFMSPSPRLWAVASDFTRDFDVAVAFYHFSKPASQPASSSCNRDSFHLHFTSVLMVLQ